MLSRKMRSFVVVSCVLLLPATVWAQGGTIAGVVKDTSGGAMPGVTVEASSPALIEKVRSAVTDGQGQYKIVSLAPGSYTVTFALTGFSTVKREGIELTTDFTATVNADLQVGALEETITVSGAASVVDTRQIVQQTNIARSTLDALPTTRRLAQLTTIMPGVSTGSTVNIDVGGIGSDQGNFAAHGQRVTDTSYNWAGIDAKIAGGGGFPYNVHSFQELVINTSAGSAEASAGGIRVNVVPKDGGNRFSGDASTENTWPSLQANNVTPELRAAGLLTAGETSVRKFYDYGFGIGGPIKKDRLWFFGAYRNLFRSQYQQGNYYNKTPNTLFYTPDLNRPAFTLDFSQDYTLRLTWQAAARHKVTAHFTQAPSCQCTIGLLNSTPIQTPEVVGLHYYSPQYMAIITYSYPVNSKLLLEVNTSMNRYSRNPKRPFDPDNPSLPLVTRDAIGVTDVGLGLQYGSRAIALSTGSGAYRPQPDERYHQRIAVSYVTGTHNFKFGVDLNQSKLGRPDEDDPNQINRATSYTFNNQVPQSVTIWATPYGTYNTAKEPAVYAQDQWTHNRLTVDYGLRYHVYDAYVPAQHLPAGPFVPVRDFPEVKHSPQYKNLSPRAGAAFDLFGTGKTAIKAALGRYAARNDPNRAIGAAILNQAESVTRNWNDRLFGPGDPRTGNFIPDCDLTNPAVNGECQAWSDLTFGQVRNPSTRYAEQALRGFNVQAYNWQSSLSLQHELRPGMALNVGYFRTWYGNFQVTDNQAVTPTNYDPYCITAPTDSRLPNSGQQVCGLYDLQPGVFGRVDNLVTLASDYGKQTEVYNGVDVTFNARFMNTGQITGGLSSSRTATNNCFTVDSPQQLRPGFCDNVRSWANGTDTKWAVVFPLPLDFQASAIYQNLPGVPILAQVVATNAQIRPTLNRDLGSCRGAATCTATVLVDLVPPNSLFGDRIQELDLRFARHFRFGRQFRLRGNFDIYNITNANSILAVNNRYNTTNWPQPLQIMGGRLFKFGALFEF